MFVLCPFHVFRINSHINNHINSHIQLLANQSLPLHMVPWVHQLINPTDRPKPRNLYLQLVDSRIDVNRI